MNNKDMSKSELLTILENGITVGELIRKLEKFDKDMLVVNGRDENYLPVSDIFATNVDK